MAQDDLNPSAAPDGATVVAKIASGLQALATLFSGATAQATTWAYMLWADTTAALLKIRNSANNGWHAVGPLKGLHGNGLVTNLKVQVLAADLTRALVTFDELSVDGTYLASGSLTLDTNNSAGANALHSGSWATSTWYELFVICNDDGSSKALLAALDGATITMPSGYTKRRHVGWLRTDSATATNLLTFCQEGSEVILDQNTTNIINGGTVTSFASGTVGLGGAVPPSVFRALCKFRVDVTAINTTGILYVQRTSGSETTREVARAQTPNLTGADKATNSVNDWVNLAGTQAFAYKMSAGSGMAGYIAVVGWRDNKVA